MIGKILMESLFADRVYLAVGSAGYRGRDDGWLDRRRWVDAAFEVVAVEIDRWKPTPLSSPRWAWGVGRHLAWRPLLVTGRSM